MATILFVDTEEPVRLLVRNVLADHDVETYDEAESALDRLQESEDVDLIISDVGLPRVSGIELADRVRSRPSLSHVPFLFLSGGGTSMPEEIVDRMDQEIIAFKPLNLPGFRRLVDSLLGDASQERFAIGPRALLDCFRSLSDSKASAILTAYRSEITKKIVIDGGKVRFAISNEPNEYIGQALIREGLVSERDLARLFEARGSRNIPLGEIFLAKTGERREALTEALRRKIQESVLDLFIWGRGVCDVHRGSVHGSDIPFAADIPLEALIHEARIRSAIWARVAPRLPGEQTRFAVNPNGVPEGELRSTGDRHLVHLLEAGRSLGEIFLEVRGQRFAVGVKIVRWLSREYVRPAVGYTFRQPSTPPIYREAINAQVSPEDDTAALPELAGEPPARAKESENPALVNAMLRIAVKLTESGQLDEARSRLLELLQKDPGNALARRCLEEVDERLTEVLGKDMTLDRRAVLVNYPQADEELTPGECFLLSRLAAEALTLKTLTQMSPLPEAEIVRTIMRFRSKGWIQIA